MTPSLPPRRSADLLLADYSDQVLAIRLGATDLLAVYGLRRGRDMTVYEIPLLAHALADVVNVLGRLDDGHVVTGPVWEYFASRSEEHTSELQSLMRISYAVFCLKKKKKPRQ